MKDRERICIYQEYGKYTLITPETIERVLVVMVLNEESYLMIHTEKSSFRIELFKVDNIVGLNILGDKLISIEYKIIRNEDRVCITTNNRIVLI
jgi:hypothetical protein